MFKTKPTSAYVLCIRNGAFLGQPVPGQLPGHFGIPRQ